MASLLFPVTLRCFWHHFATGLLPRRPVASTRASPRGSCRTPGRRSAHARCPRVLASTALWDLSAPWDTRGAPWPRRASRGARSGRGAAPHASRRAWRPGGCPCLRRWASQPPLGPTSDAARRRSASSPGTWDVAGLRGWRGMQRCAFTPRCVAMRRWAHCRAHFRAVTRSRISCIQIYASARAR